MSETEGRTAILLRVIQSSVGSCSTEPIRDLLALDFPSQDHARFQELSTKASNGSLTNAEAGELDDYLHVDSVLAIIRLRALRSMDHRNNLLQ